MRRRNRRLWIAGLLAVLTLGSCDTKYADDLRGLGARVEYLEKHLKQINDDITTLSLLIHQINTDGYVTSITKNADGSYTITFNDGNIVTLRNGKVGQNGRDGQDGKDTDFKLSVSQDVDGIWYWTLNGQWLLDANGERMRASAIDGRDGKDGRNGTDGVDGVDGHDGHDGKDGKDGKDDINMSLPIPRVRISDDGLWEISTDNGITWVSTGIVANGKDGKDGNDGRADIFYSVTPTADGTGLIIMLANGEGPYTIPILQQQ